MNNLAKFSEQLQEFTPNMRGYLSEDEKLFTLIITAKNGEAVKYVEFLNEEGNLYFDSISFFESGKKILITEESFLHQILEEIEYEADFNVELPNIVF